MPCCGGSTIRTTPIDGRAASQGPVLFEYRGYGAFTTHGRVTGVRYHFAGPLARMPVDERDAPSLDVVHGLERVTPTA